MSENRENNSPKKELRPVVVRSRYGHQKNAFFHRWVNHFVLAESEGYYVVMALIETENGKIERWDAEALTFIDRPKSADIDQA